VTGSWSILDDDDMSHEDFISIPSSTAYSGVGEWVEEGDFDALELSLDDLRDWDAGTSQHEMYICRALERFEVGFYGVRGAGGQSGLGTIFEEGC
jgi:hypothetical protein